MSKPQVTLTLAGDGSQLEKTFDSVGASSRKMADDVGASSKRVGDDTSNAYDRAGEAADNVDTKAMGFRDTLTGVQDTMSGTAMIARGDLFTGFFTLGAGIGDLGSGFYNLLIPAFKAFSLESLKATAATARQTAVTTAQRGATLASAAATRAMTVAQRLLNVAFLTSPIGIIIGLVALLAVGIVLLWKKSETFRRIVTGAFNGFLSAVRSAWGWVKGNWPLLLAILTGPVGIAVLVIKRHRDSILGFFRAVPGAIAGFFKGVASVVTAPFRAAFNGIRSAWNSTVGGKGFSVPGWVPNIGGKGFHIPYFHTGGVVSGAMGSETLAVLKAGERVTGGRAGSSSGVVVLRSDGSRVGKLLLQIWREAVKAEGGIDVVLS